MIRGALVLVGLLCWCAIPTMLVFQTGDNPDHYFFGGLGCFFLAGLLGHFAKVAQIETELEKAQEEIVDLKRDKRFPRR